MSRSSGHDVSSDEEVEMRRRNRQSTTPHHKTTRGRYSSSRERTPGCNMSDEYTDDEIAELKRNPQFRKYMKKIKRKERLRYERRSHSRRRTRDRSRSQRPDRSGTTVVMPKTKSKGKTKFNMVH